MNFEEYREKGKETVDYIADYLENIRTRRVFPDVTPGYIRELLPAEAPIRGEKWEDIFKDVERVIMPGITHWQSPHMHAYFPALNSFPSLLGDMISDAINCIGFTWASSPAATELEALMMDWLVKCLGLPEKFLGSNYDSLGGGVLQTSVSESTYYALLAARTKIFEKYGVSEIDKYAEKSELNGRLVCFCSDQAHSSVEKSALVALTRIELLPTDENHQLRGETLREAIEQCKRDGLIPFFVCATLGTTGVCAFDNLEEIGPICASEGLWLHIDAAYAGSAFFCPEFRKFIKGIEYANSFVFNPSKWLMVSFDCTSFWVDNSQWLHKTFTVAPLYLKHRYSGAAIDYMHWQVGLSRKFRALKLWFVLRSFGIEGIQAHIRKSVELAKLFESYVRKDDRFEILAERHLGLVVFRLKGENNITEKLLKQLNKDGLIHVVPARVTDQYIIRFTVTSYHTTEADIGRDWRIIESTASKIMREVSFGSAGSMLSTSPSSGSTIEELSRSPVNNNATDVIIEDDELAATKKQRFQSSLLLSNVPQTPKVVNASFLAFFPDMDLTLDVVKELTKRDYAMSHLPLKPRRRKPNKASRLACSLDYGGGRVRWSSLSSPPPSVWNGDELNLDELTLENGSKENGNCHVENDLNGKKLTPKYWPKQASLDSKIENMLDEADEAKIASTNNTINGESPEN